MGSRRADGGASDMSQHVDCGDCGGGERKMAGLGDTQFRDVLMIS